MEPTLSEAVGNPIATRYAWGMRKTASGTRIGSDWTSSASIANEIGTVNQTESGIGRTVGIGIGTAKLNKSYFEIVISTATSTAKAENLTAWMSDIAFCRHHRRCRGRFHPYLLDVDSCSCFWSCRGGALDGWTSSGR